MHRVAVLGGGISGLSTAYYLKLLRPSLQVSLFEGGKLGGWIETIRKDDFTFETGPRSIRFSGLASNFMDIASNLNIIARLRVSETKSGEANIYADGRMSPLVPMPPFRMAKMLARPAILRTAIKNIIPRLKVEPVEDESIDAFIRKAVRFWSEKDAEYVIGTLVDSMIQGIYSGDITKLSARSCSPTRSVFHKRYFGLDEPTLTPTSSRARLIFYEGSQKKANAMTFEGGLSTLTDGILGYLESQPDFTFVKERVTSLKNKVVRTATGKEMEFDHVVSTIPAFNLSSLFDWDMPELKSMSSEVPYNSLWTINLGYSDPLSLKVSST